MRFFRRNPKLHYTSTLRLRLIANFLSTFQLYHIHSSCFVLPFARHLAHPASTAHFLAPLLPDDSLAQHLRIKSPGAGRTVRQDGHWQAAWCTTIIRHPSLLKSQLVSRGKSCGPHEITLTVTQQHTRHPKHREKTNSTTPSRPYPNNAARDQDLPPLSRHQTLNQQTYKQQQMAKPLLLALQRH